MKTNSKLFGNKEIVLLLSVFVAIYSHYAAVIVFAVFASMTLIDSIGGIRNKKALKNISIGALVMTVMFVVAYFAISAYIKH